MTDTAATFLAKSKIRSADLDHRRKINFNIGKYNAKVPEGKEQFADVHFARERQRTLSGEPSKASINNWKISKPILPPAVAKWCGLKLLNRPLMKYSGSARK